MTLKSIDIITVSDKYTHFVRVLCSVSVWPGVSVHWCRFLFLSESGCHFHNHYCATPEGGRCVVLQKTSQTKKGCCWYECRTYLFHCSQHMMFYWNTNWTIEYRALFVSLMEKRRLLPRAKHESYIGTSTRVYKPI